MNEQTNTPPAERPTLTAEENNAIRFNDAIVGVTSERPTPITDAAAIALHGTRLAPGCIYVKAEDMKNIERQLDAMMERALIAEKRLSEALALAESNGKLAHDTAIELREAREQRDRLAAQFTKLDKPKYSGAPMMDKVLAVRNPEFDAWVQTLPATYWTRYDLSAARIGWEAAKGGIQ